MSDPKLIFRREPEDQHVEATRWGVDHDGVRLGYAYRSRIGYWGNDRFGSGYATRYEAGYSLYTATTVSS